MSCVETQADEGAYSKCWSFCQGKNDLEDFIVSNIHDIIPMARKTDAVRGRTSDDKRLLIHFIILGCIPSTRINSKFHLRQIAWRLGIPESSFRDILKQAK